MNLKEMRLSKGLSQQQVADELGISVMTYNHIENNKTTPKYATCAKIAEFFGTEPWVEPAKPKPAKKTDSMVLAEWVSEKLSEHKMTLTELANEAHIAYTEVCNIARGDYIPARADTIINIVSAFTEVFTRRKVVDEAYSPLSWIARHNPSYSPFDDSEETTYTCPICCTEQEHKSKFCSNCGVRLL